MTATLTLNNGSFAQPDQNAFAIAAIPGRGRSQMRKLNPLRPELRREIAKPRQNPPFANPRETGSAAIIFPTPLPPPNKMVVLTGA
jgi:hypothetical protein